MLHTETTTTRQRPEWNLISHQATSALKLGNAGSETFPQICGKLGWESDEESNTNQDSHEFMGICLHSCSRNSLTSTCCTCGGVEEVVVVVLVKVAVVFVVIVVEQVLILLLVLWKWDGRHIN